MDKSKDHIHVLQPWMSSVLQQVPLMSLILCCLHIYLPSCQVGKHDEAWMILKQIHDTNMRARGQPEKVFTVSVCLWGSTVLAGFSWGLRKQRGLYAATTRTGLKIFIYIYITMHELGWVSTQFCVIQTYLLHELYFGEKPISNDTFLDINLHCAAYTVYWFYILKKIIFVPINVY